MQMVLCESTMGSQQLSKKNKHFESDWHLAQANANQAASACTQGKTRLGANRLFCACKPDPTNNSPRQVRGGGLRHFAGQVDD